MNKLKYFAISIILIMSLVLAGTSFGVSARPLDATAPGLGAATSFSALAALSAASANTTTLSGDLGLSPGLPASITGPWVVGGSTYAGPLTLAADAQLAALGAFGNLAGQTSNGAWSGNISPVPGVWTEASDTTFTGTLTLNGGYDDVWVFQIGRDMTFSGAVVMGGTAQACHVFWQIGRDVTITLGTIFTGTLIASRDVTLVSGATVSGPIMSLYGALTTDNNTISAPGCASAPAAVDTPAGSAADSVSGLPNTGGAPIRNQEFPWSLVIAGSLSVAALALGVRSYRRTHLPKQ